MTESVRENATRFAGKRAIVTGAGAGIGRATALQLIKEGAQVAVIDWNVGKAEAVAAESLNPENALALQADCADEDSIRAAIEAAAAEFGGLDVVVANAGIEDERERPVDQADLAVWQRLLHNNLDGQFLTCKYGIRELLASGGGAVVCLGSNVAHLGVARGEPAYSASKGGVHAMMRVMANDYIRSGIRVNMVIPGLIDTQMNTALYDDPEYASYWLNQVPIGRPGRAEECAEAICWLASDDASYCVGSALTVDGGQSMI